jgi:hypothetical protein
MWRTRCFDALSVDNLEPCLVCQCLSAFYQQEIDNLHGCSFDYFGGKLLLIHISTGVNTTISLVNLIQLSLTRLWGSPSREENAVYVSHQFVSQLETAQLGR